MINTIYLWLILVIAWTGISVANAQDGLFADEETVPHEGTMIDSIAVADSIGVEWPQRLETRLQELLEHEMFQTSQVGLMVYDLTADSLLFQHNGHQVMRPASTMKLVTAITAIDCLGGSFRFITELRYTGSVDNKTLTGALYCKGGFDPLFNRDDLRAFVESIRQMGVDTIRGQIVADKSLKDGNLLGEGWCWDDDNPVLSPLLISGKDEFTERFMLALSEAGLVVEADTLTGITPSDAFFICSRFHTIDQVLIPMMKDSDNLFAEALFYRIAAIAGTSYATARHARDIIQHAISKAAPASKRFRIADGSGLSLYNYLTPAIEVALLRYAYRNSNIYLHLFPTLPVAGEDGTLKSRMKNSFAHGNVWAKTGTLVGVSSLAGYAQASNGHLLCFSIMNQGLMHTRNGRSFQDRVCSALCEP